jgi:hypothetical protein
VTLPTGEKIIFQKESKEIVTGVFEEGPVDIGQHPLDLLAEALEYRLFLRAVAEFDIQF